LPPLPHHAFFPRLLLGKFTAGTWERFDAPCRGLTPFDSPGLAFSLKCLPIAFFVEGPSIDSWVLAIQML